MDSIDFAALLGDDDSVPKKAAPRSVPETRNEKSVEKQKDKFANIEPQRRKVAHEVCFLIFEFLQRLMCRKVISIP